MLVGAELKQGLKSSNISNRSLTPPPVQRKKQGPFALANYVSESDEAELCIMNRGIYVNIIYSPKDIDFMGSR